MDESGMPLDHKQLKRVAKRGAKKVYGRASGNKAQITIVACANAAGHTLPPMVIFKGERLNHDYTKGEVPGTLYGMSKQGWIDSELFYCWLSSLFLPNIPPARPVLLLLDGHSTHYTPEAVRKAHDEGVIMLCLPPHTTHTAQPLDVSFFGPLKKHWSSVCHSYMLENPGKVVTKFQFSDLFRQAWYKAINPEAIVAGFRKVGVYPFNRTAIKCMPRSGDDETLDTEQGDEGDLSGDNLSNQEEGGVDYSGDLDPEEDLSPSFNLFTPLEEELFKTRYENGYDLLIDPNYVSWLGINHPEALPENLQQSPNLSDNEMETDTPLLTGDTVAPSLERANVNETDLLTTDTTSTEVSHNDPTTFGDAFNGTSPNSSASVTAKSPGRVTKVTTPSTIMVTPTEIAASTTTTSCILPSSSVEALSPTGSAVNLTTPSGATVKPISPLSTVSSSVLEHTNPAVTGHKSKTLPSSSSNATSPTSSVLKHTTPPASAVKQTSPSTSTMTSSTGKPTTLMSTILKSTTLPGSVLKPTTPDRSSSGANVSFKTPVSNAKSTSKVTTPAVTANKSSVTVTPPNDTPNIILLSTSQTTQRRPLTPITSFLNKPPTFTKTNTKGKTKPGAARVLTSDQSLALLEEKERKKHEEEEAKERRKVEREKKRIAREAENKRKSEERQRKALEREEKKKLQQRKREMKQRKSSRKSGESSKSERGLQNEEISSNECAVCLGAYEDELDANGQPLYEWVQCTSEKCGKWMHQDCLDVDDMLYVCGVCENVFQ